MEHALALLVTVVLIAPIILHWWRWDLSTNIFERAMNVASTLVGIVVAIGMAEAYSWLIAIPAWLAFMLIFEFVAVLLEDVLALVKRIFLACIHRLT